MESEDLILTIKSKRNVSGSKFTVTLPRFHSDEKKAERRLVKQRKGNHQSMHKREKKRHTPRFRYVEPLLGTEHP